MRRAVKRPSPDIAGKIIPRRGASAGINLEIMDKYAATPKARGMVPREMKRGKRFALPRNEGIIAARNVNPPVKNVAANKRSEGIFVVRYSENVRQPVAQMSAMVTKLMMP